MFFGINFYVKLNRDICTNKKDATIKVHAIMKEYENQYINMPETLSENTRNIFKMVTNLKR